MDSIKGAIELRELFEKLGVTEADDRKKESAVPEHALPIFHWLGVTPTPDAAPE